jgi:hypothetical protein
MLQTWQLLHRIPAFLRWPLKLVLAVVFSVLILFPKVWLLPVEYERITNVESLIEPDHPALAPLEQAVREGLQAQAHAPVQTQAQQRVRRITSADLTEALQSARSDSEAVDPDAGADTADGPALTSTSSMTTTPPAASTPTAADPTLAESQPLNSDQLQIVERVVYAAVPYAHDWETWGVMQYTPTVGEALAAGHEDCDGRAVVAASLLRRLGMEAWIVSDLQHAWVRTPVRDVMGAGLGEATVKQDQQGGPVTINWNWSMVSNVTRGMSYGIGVFPLTRMLCFYLLIVGLTVHPWSPINRRLLGAGLLLIALGMIREGGSGLVVKDASTLWAWSGFAAFVVGWLLLAVKAGGKPRRASAPESQAANTASPG